jgi:hypothetical protein
VRGDLLFFLVIDCCPSTKREKREPIKLKKNQYSWACKITVMVPHSWGLFFSLFLHKMRERGMLVIVAISRAWLPRFHISKSSTVILFEKKGLRTFWHHCVEN